MAQQQWPSVTTFSPFTIQPSWTLVQHRTQHTCEKPPHSITSLYFVWRSHTDQRHRNTSVIISPGSLPPPKLEYVTVDHVPAGAMSGHGQTWASTKPGLRASVLYNRSALIYIAASLSQHFPLYWEILRSNKDQLYGFF